MMKTIFIIADFSADYPGNFISSLISLEKELGNQFEIFYFLGKNESFNYKNWFKEFSKNRICHQIDFNEDGAKSILKLAKEANPQYVYFHFGGLRFPVSVYRGLNRKKRRRVKFIYHIHSRPNIGAGFKQKIKLLGSKILCPKKLTFICSSKEIFSIISKNYPKNKAFLVLNKIDFNRLEFNPGKECSSIKDCTALTFCYEYYIKGGDYAAEIAKRCHQKSKNFRLLMVVARNLETIKKHLERDYPDYNEYITILGPSSDVYKIYAKSSIYLLPSRTEGLPYSAIEASYSGLTVIASDIPEIRTVNIPRIKFFGIGDATTAVRLIEESFDSVPSFASKEDYSEFGLKNWAKEIRNIIRSL